MKSFPHILIPHIDGYRWKIISVSYDARYVTQENIQHILNKEAAYLPMKGIIWIMTAGQGLMDYLYSSYKNGVRYYSSIIHFIPG